MSGDRANDDCVLCTSDADRCRRCAARLRLPGWRPLQAFITLVTGAPHRGQRPLVRKGPRLCALGSFTVLAVSVGLGAAAVLMLTTPFSAAPRLWAVPAVALSVVVSSGSFRAMHNFVLHHASHGDFGRHSRLVGDAAGVVGMTQSFSDYRRDHLVHHSALTSELDPDQQALAALGFLPGLPRAAYPRLLRRALLHPAPLLHTVGGRLRGCLSARPHRLRPFVFLAVHGSLLLAAVAWSWSTAWEGPVLAWVVAWLLPLTLGHHISTVLYALGLHAWYRQSSGPGWSGFAEKTGARFFADNCPAKTGKGPVRLIQWARWWLRLLFWHLLVARVLVIGFTDNGCHDAHHADPGGRRFDWCNAAYARSALLAQLPQARVHFWHTWSLDGAIRQNFDQLAAQHRTP